MVKKELNKISITLRVLLMTLFVVSLVTGLSVLIGGVESILSGVTNVDASVDNEIRFFATYWLAYGVFCCWVAINLKERLSYIPSIAVIFFLSGLARLFSVVIVGVPESLLIAVMILELVLPFIMYFLYLKQKRLDYAK